MNIWSNEGIVIEEQLIRLWIYSWLPIVSIVSQKPDEAIHVLSSIPS